MYEGKILDNANKNDVEVNLVYVDMKQSIPQYYSKNPKIFFEPEKPGAEKAAEIKELLVNQKWAKLKMKPLMRNAIKRTKLDGMVAFKTYFNFSTDFKKDEWNDRIYNDEVRTDVVPLKNLLKDPDVHDWNKSPWIAHKIRAKIKDIAAKFNIKNLDDITVTDSTKGSSDKSAEVQRDFQYGIYYEIEDREEERTFYIVEGIDKILKAKDQSYSYDTMYDFLMYNDIPDRQPYSDYHFYKKQIKEIAVYRTMMKRHALKGNSKYKVLGKPLNDTQMLQLTSSKDTTMVNLENGQDIQPLVHANVDPQVFSAYNLASSDVQLLSKQAPRQTVGGDKTATEVKAVELASREVSSENLEALENVMASIATKWAILMEENYTSSRVVRLTEMSEAQYLGYQNSIGDVMKGDAKHPFIEVNSKHLMGECSAKVKAGSTQPDSDQDRQNKLLGFSKFVSQLPNAQQALDFEELVDEAVDVFDVRNDNLTRRKDNPMEESRLLNSGAFISAKMSEDHDAHLAIHERESNGNDVNLIHILEHKMFKQQLENNKNAKVESAIKKIQEQGPLSGQSFVGAEPQQSPLPAQNQQAPQAPVNNNTSGLPQ